MILHLVPCPISGGHFNLSYRAGFCDITGQTNERTLLAAVVPGRDPCGNKVPTLKFDNDDNRLPLLWVAIANSFVLDWLVRRVMSTTLNFFHLRQLPFPRLNLNEPIAQELLVASAQLANIHATSKSIIYDLDSLSHPEYALIPLQQLDYQERAVLRAKIDAIVASLYHLSLHEYILILSDFPLLDRYQPSISLSTLGKKRYSEKRSTITRDIALQYFLEFQGKADSLNIDEDIGSQPPIVQNLIERLELARNAGSIAYIPSEHARAIKINV